MRDLFLCAIVCGTSMSLGAVLTTLMAVAVGGFELIVVYLIVTFSFGIVIAWCGVVAAEFAVQ